MDAEQLVGRELSHYRILAKLGAGGMGEVFQELMRQMAYPEVSPSGSRGSGPGARIRG